MMLDLAQNSPPKVKIPTLTIIDSSGEKQNMTGIYTLKTQKKTVFVLLPILKRGGKQNKEGPLPIKNLPI